MLTSLFLLSLVFGLCGAQDVHCRCQPGKNDGTDPTYPSIITCKIPNSNDQLNSFVESDPTWNPVHEFGDAFTLTPATCPTPTTPCQQVLMTNDGRWKCETITPKCWRDALKVENSIMPAAGYGCATDTKAAVTGTKCPIKCATGFKLVGGPTTCQNGKWANYPRCNSAGCGKPPLPANAVGFTKPCTKGVKGTTCSIKCKTGYLPSGSVICGAGGKWTSTAKCVKPKPKDCHGKTLTKPGHGKWNCQEVNVGGTCPLVCPTGYTPKGTMPKCGTNGQWIVVKNAKSGPHCACKPFQHIGPNTPPACIFTGFSGLDRMDFVVDVSGSMSKGKITYQKKSLNRLQYIQVALRDTIVGLQPYQYFNLIRYSSKAYVWKNAVVIANAANKASGTSWVNALRASGSTNIYDGLRVAMKDPTVQGIFILTDGSPTTPAKYNYRNWGNIHNFYKNKNNWASKKIKKLFPIAFQAPALSWKNMQLMAKNTGGKAHKVG